MTDPIEYDELAEALASGDQAAGEDSVTADSAPAEEPEAEPSADETAGPTEEPEGEEPAVDEDDVTVAVDAATENVDGTTSLDDIAPGTVATAEGEPISEAATDPSASTVSIWPFVIYDLLWAAFAGLLVWQLQTLPPGTAVYEAELYPTALLVGVILLVAGPLLILVSWIAAWGKPGSTKGRLFLSALVRGSVATLLGVSMWWIALIALDQLRLGAPL